MGSRKRLHTTGGDSGHRRGDPTEMNFNQEGKNQTKNQTDDGCKATGEANEFAKSEKLKRSPVQNLEATASTSSINHQGEQLQQKSVKPGVSPQSGVEVAKKLVDELHEYVDKRHNVHKDIKGLVTKIQRALGLATKEWKMTKQRAETAESELAAVKKAQATAILKPVSFSSVLKSKNVDKSAAANVVNTPLFTPKRARSSPVDASQNSKKPKEDRGRAIGTESISAGRTNGVNKGTPWQVVGRREAQTRKKKEKKTTLIKEKKKGEAIIVKSGDDSYSEILRTMRTAPELAELGADVRKIRRTRTGDMIFELKRDPKHSSSSYKELTEKIMGEKVTVKAMCPEATIVCKDIDEVTSEEELNLALKEQCQLGAAQMTIRMRKGPFGTQVATIRLPVQAANKALKVGKIKVGWSMCPLSISQRPEICYKCQEFGHLARNCRGPDRANLCRRCGEDGHKAHDCRKPPKCLICVNKEDNDHVTGGPRCPAFKQAVATKSQWR